MRVHEALHVSIAEDPGKEMTAVVNPGVTVERKRSRGIGGAFGR